MNQEDINSVFDTALLALVGLGDIHLDDGSVYYPDQNKPYVVGKLSAFQRTPLGAGIGTLISITGSYTITLVRPSIEGRATGGRLAGQIRAQFSRGTSLAVGTNSSVIIVNSAEQPAVNQPDWIHFPVVVSFLASDI